MTAEISSLGAPTTTTYARTRNVRSFVAGSVVSEPNRSRQDIVVHFPESVPDGHRAAMTSALAEINALRRLRRGWDGENAEEITDPAADSALQIVNRFSVPGRLRVQIFPLFGGGLQLEWAAWGDRIECEVEADGSIYMICLPVNANRPSIEVSGQSPYALDDFGRAYDFLKEMSVNLGHR